MLDGVRREAEVGVFRGGLEGCIPLMGILGVIFSKMHLETS